MGATSSYVVYLQQAVRPAFRGTVPNLGDLTTDEYSFVIKCPASRHLPVRRKNSSALQGRWLEEPEGFSILSFCKGNKTAIMAAARRTEGA